MLQQRDDAVAVGRFGGERDDLELRIVGPLQHDVVQGDVAELGPRPPMTGNGPVTVLAIRRPRLGREREFEAFLEELREVFRRVPGNTGVAVLPPSGTERDYAILYRFDSAASLRAWREGADRAAVIEASSSITESAPHERTTTGLETWFATADAGVVAPPAPWRTWLLTTVGFYPIITVVSTVTGPLLAALPAPLRFLLVTPVLTALMTWVVMPALSRAFARFLYAPHPPSQV